MHQQAQFLQNIVNVFLDNVGNELRDYCFVFPNRRSGLFFQKYLKETSTNAKILPGITSISEFVCDLTHKTECGRIELMLDLYEEYRAIAKENSESFDEFSYWGEVILNDFNDVDLYMVDADEMFQNLREYNEIGTDYLDENQKKALKEYFGDNFSNNELGKEYFWKHTRNHNTEKGNTKEYFRLWEMLGLLYTNLNKRLAQKGVAYGGRIYRAAAEMISNIDPDSLNFKQYVFIGFNVLSTSEIKIFEGLKNKGIADFYWDMNSPALRDENNKATRFISLNSKRFKSKYELPGGDITTFPNLKIKALPTNVGQVKYASTIIDELVEKNQVGDVDNLIDTAIVLPDENLFIPLCGSIDKQTRTTNITLGFPLKKSLTSVLLSLVAKLHRQSRKINNEWCYYIEDLKELLSHPFLKLTTQKEAQILFSELAKERPFYVSSSLLKNRFKSFNHLLIPIEEKSVSGLIQYVQSIMHCIEQDIIPSFTNNEKEAVERSCAIKYIELFNTLIKLIGKYTLEFNDSTFFYLIDRFISGQTISMQGEPLEGLQIMGVLETRCLDFRNIVILSMNERVFPRKHFSRSFISYTLRKGYGLSTVEHQESMYAYYFYRMISKAENVFLLYDARTTGLGSGDPSRFIQQLCRVYGNSNAKIDYVSFGLSKSADNKIIIPKSDRILTRLSEYQKGGERYLSASSINSYLSCPLKFYFEKVEHLYINDPINEFIDASTFGSIVHEIMKRLYENASPSSNGLGKLISKSYIESLEKNNGLAIDRVIVQVVNYLLNKKGEFCDDPLDGVGYMLHDVIKHYVYEILKKDKQQEFIYIKGEQVELGYWDDIEINFKQVIDRLDLVIDGDNEYYRIVDYKTGKDETSIYIDDDRLRLNYESKAVNQILMYCHFYNSKNNTDVEIKPEIYTVKNMSQAEVVVKAPGGKKKEIIYNHKNFTDQFIKSLNKIVTEIFDENVPFTQTEDETRCEYCKFKEFCAK